MKLMSQPVEKKKPGRPRKNPDVRSIISQGIVAKASEPDRIVEFAYNAPNILKKVITLQKAFAVGDVEITFGLQETVFVSATQPDPKIKVQIRFEGMATNRYYCAAPITVRVAQSQFEQLLENLTKEHEEVLFVLKEDYRKQLYCILRNTVLNSEKTYTIPVVANESPIDMTGCDNSAYPLKFKISSKVLKQEVLGMKGMSPIMIIVKAGDGPLQFTCDSTKENAWDSTYYDLEKLSVACTLAPTDILRVLVEADKIKSFTQHAIANDIYVSIDKDGPMALTAFAFNKDVLTTTMRVFITQEVKQLPL
jgi:hypothetical protein